MAGREYLSSDDAYGERSSEDIRRNIAKEKENISQKVDEIGDRIKEKLDWREHVKDYPYLALGVAVGLGFIGSRLLTTRTTPMERIMNSIAGEVGGSLGGAMAGPGLIKLTLLGIAAKAAARWIQSEASADATAGPQTGHDSAVRPSAGH